MRVVICWTEIAGYTAACWRARRRGGGGAVGYRVAFELLTIGDAVRAIADGGVARPLSRGGAAARRRPRRRLVGEHKPEILLMGGWAERPYRRLVFNDVLGDCRFVLAMDTPWKGTLRQRFAGEDFAVCGSPRWDFRAG